MDLNVFAKEVADAEGRKDTEKIPQVYQRRQW
jgi:hypothetical protein